MTDRKEHRKHLFYLHELSDFKVDSDDPDVRGWKVKDVDNRVVGKVDNLLVSKAKKRVVYLDVEVDSSIIEANHDPYGNPASSDVHEFVNKKGENHLILPIGLARLNVDEKYVYTDRINHQTFAETKRMEKGYDVDRDYELVVLESYNRDRDGDTNRRDNDFEVDTQTGNYRSGDTGSRSTGAGIDDERRRMNEADKDKTNRDRSGMTESLDTDRNLSNRDRDLTDRDRTGTTGTTGSTGDRDRDKTGTSGMGTAQTGAAGTGTTGSLSDRDRDLTDRDKNMSDRDRNLTDRDRDLNDDRRRSSDDESFYDRGEFDRTKYRSNR